MRQFVNRIKLVMFGLVATMALAACGDDSPSVTTPGGVPAAPAGVTAAAGNGQVTVSWGAVAG
ncbi:MAG: hypothetical protein WA140_12975, partial [Geobacteraceae bacterium]